MIPFSEILKSVPPERFITIAGQRIYVEQHGSPVSHNTPILMLHGFAASSFSFHKIIPQLSENRRVIAIDLNGFGLTERPDETEKYHPAHQIRTIIAVMDYLGIDRFDLLGHSYGTALSVFLGIKNSDRVRKMILISPLHEFGNPPLLMRSKIGRTIAYWFSRALVASPKTFQKMQAKAYFQKEQLTTEIAEKYRMFLQIEGLKSAVYGFGEAMCGDEESNIPFSDFFKPTLILAGKRDEVNPLENCEKVAIQLTNCEMQILERSGHSVPEEEPERTAELIERFL